MPIEDAAVVGSATTVTRNGLGARGIDFISTTTSSGTNVAYPIYDGHGNMVATLAKNGSGYTIGNRRSFGAWGEIRQGATSGTPKGRYCANLGHLDDDESGLTYMRARYYEPGSGRFLGEDTARHDWNWFSYCGNDPVNRFDSSGKFWQLLIGLAALWVVSFLSVAAFQSIANGKVDWGTAAISASVITGAALLLVFFFPGVATVLAIGSAEAAAGALTLAIFRVSSAGLAGAAVKAFKESGLGKAVFGIMGGQLWIAAVLAEMQLE